MHKMKILNQLMVIRYARWNNNWVALIETNQTKIMTYKFYQKNILYIQDET